MIDDMTIRGFTAYRCPCCGGRMIVIKTVEHGNMRRHQAAINVIGIDSS